MKDIKIKIRPYNQSNKKDKIAARILEEQMNIEKEKFNGVIDKILIIQTILLKVYGVEIEMAYWNDLMGEVIKLNLKNNIERDLKNSI